jgi:rhodanese-related sulfurtransferase
MCGKSLSQETVSTIGEQKRFNYALQPMSLEEFKRLVTSDQPEAPSYFVYDAVKNRQERPDLEATMRSSLKALSLDDVIRLKNQGAQLVDVRESADFAGAHLVGSINIGLKGKYATWCGSMLNHQAPIVVIAEPGSEEEAVMRLGRIGFDNVAGYLRDGMAALEPHPELVRTIPRITAQALAEQLNEPNPPFVLDVRTEKEWQAGHVPGSHNIPLTHLRERLAEVPSDRSVVVHCEGGYRSSIATSVLAAAGRTNVTDLVGGIKAWLASKLPTDR